MGQSRGEVSAPGQERREEWKSGARIGEKMDENFFCSLGIQRGRLAPKVRGIEAQN